MKKIYLDTSSLIKAYHRESDSDKIIKILPEYQCIFLSELTKIELACVVSVKEKADTFLISDKILQNIFIKEGLNVVH